MHRQIVLSKRCDCCSIASNEEILRCCGSTKTRVARLAVQDRYGDLYAAVDEGSGFVVLDVEAPATDL